MTNAELIKALREAKKHFWTQPQIELYPMMEAAADVLEADEKFHAELIKNIEHWKKQVIRLRAQLPKEGEWIPNSPFTGNCSECGGDGNLKDKYCPNCGARMRGGQEETKCKE